MSVTYMESWMALPRMAGDDADNATNNAARDLSMRALMAYGYEYYRQAANGGWVIRQHPVFPERNALVFSAPGAQNAQYHVRRPLGQAGQTIIGGFSLFIPGTFISDQGSSGSYPFMTVSVAAASAPIANMTGNDSLAAGEMFRIGYNLRVQYGSESQSTRRITPGKLAYLEYQITPTEFRVWLDDVLVLQKNVTLTPETIDIATVSWIPSGGYSGMWLADGRWAIADVYTLVVDDVVPSTRLGPSTRVIGTVPESDVAVQFARPSGYASNAAVVAQPFDPNSSNFLKTDTPGAKDLYVGAADNETATASLVHAVGVKIVAQNMESAPHVMQPIVSAGGNDQGTSYTLNSNLVKYAHISHVDPSTGQAWTPSGATTARFGMKLVS